MKTINRTIWTIGHSTHTADEFLGLLRLNNIEVLADVRSFPGSRAVPQFNKETLSVFLVKHGIEYRHIEKLGGRRRVAKDSKNTAWENPSFRGYADYMETADFLDGIQQLENIALEKRTAFMCAEALWWRCHRSMISDYLKNAGWTVLHIMDKNQPKEHHYTQPAKIINNQLTYRQD